MSPAASLQPEIDRLREVPGRLCSGRVTQVLGSVVCSEGPLCFVGEECKISTSSGRTLSGEVVGFRGPLVLSMPLSSTEGIRFGDRVTTRGTLPSVPVSERLVGRVLNALGEPIDDLVAPTFLERMPIHARVPEPLARRPITQPLGCGIRAIDSLLTTGLGQRIGIFGGSGVGKTTLIGMMARATAADLTVLALVGERGREVGEFLESLGEEGRKQSVVVVSTSDQSALLRIRAALTATSVAEYFAVARAERAAGCGFADTICDGAARDRPRCRRATHREGIHSFRLFIFGEIDGACWEFSHREHHRVLHRVDGGRRSTGSDRGRGAVPSGWTHRSRPQACDRKSLSADLGPR